MFGTTKLLVNCSTSRGKGTDLAVARNGQMFPWVAAGGVPVVAAESSTSKTSSKTCPSTAAATDTRGRVLVLAGRFGEWEAFKIP